MKKELADYRVSPKVFLVGKPTDIIIAPRGYHANFAEHENYQLRFVPMEQSIEPLGEEHYPTIEATAKNGALAFSYSFPAEQMYLIRVLKDGERLLQFPVYALLPDLFARRPLKGDLHVHSCNSDGHEEPAVVAANYRKNGFDFMALTDHSKWRPSQELIARYEGIPTDLHLFYGEEIHVSRDYIHAINFGGSSSVNEYYYGNEAKCEAEIKALSETLTLPEGLNAMDIARRVWIAREIQKTGGMAILVHPHWMNNAYNMPETVCDYLFGEHTYDAFELLGGQSVFENNMQTGMYQEQRAKGRKIPAVGSSDSHGTEPGLYFHDVFTLVFAESTSLDGICGAVKDLYSVAVENYPGEENRVHGPYRMVKYALFLLNEYFPEYRELCFEQGRAMKEWATENPEAIRILELLKGRTDRYYGQFFGR